MYSNIIFFIIIGFSINICNARKNYTNYALYRGIPVNDSHLHFFTKLSEKFDVNFWIQPATMFQKIDFVINPTDKSSMLTYAKSLGVFLELLRENVQSAFDKQKVVKYMRTKKSTMNWQNYYRLEDIYAWLNDLASDYPNHVTLKTIGQTVNKKDIIAVKITLSSLQPRSVVIVEGGIHAREWISIAFVTYLINEIISTLSPTTKDPTMKFIAQTYEWYLVPVLNPDGYEYTHTDDRLWRKNRNGAGVDLNRNFDNYFGKFGVPPYPGSDIFPGSHAFSEAESKAMAGLVELVSHRLEYYLSFHSYGQYIVIPYTHSSQHYDNYEEVFAMCREAALQMAKTSKTQYTVGNSYETLGYLSSGVSMCWVKENHRVPYALTFELRDEGTYGFALPPNQILPTCVETLDGLKSLLIPRHQNVTKLRFLSSNQLKIISDRIMIVLNLFLFYYSAI